MDQPNIVLKRCDWFLKFLNITVERCDWFLKFLNIVVKTLCHMLHMVLPMLLPILHVLLPMVLHMLLHMLLPSISRDRISNNDSWYQFQCYQLFMRLWKLTTDQNEFKSRLKPQKNEHTGGCLLFQVKYRSKRYYDIFRVGKIAKSSF